MIPASRSLISFGDKAAAEAMAGALVLSVLKNSSLARRRGGGEVDQTWSRSLCCLQRSEHRYDKLILNITRLAGEISAARISLLMCFAVLFRFEATAEFA